MIRVVNGDLLAVTSGYICHQVNCMGAMNSGVAKSIRAKWPAVFERYKALCGKYGGKEYLLMGRVQPVKVSETLAVVNLFGQLEYGHDGKEYTSIGALTTACESLASRVKKGTAIAMPYRIGCGLGGGDWGEVMDMLTEVFDGQNLTLYKLS